MYLAILIAIAILVAILIALEGIFGKFPTEWEWVGMVIAIAGLTMGFPTVLQMLGGRPKLKTEFERDAQGEKRLLLMFLKNPPVTNKVLTALGVTRDSIQSLTVQFRVSEAGSNKIEIPIRQARIFSDDDSDESGKWRTALPPTYSVGAGVVFATWDESNGGAVIPPSRNHGETLLPSGYYRVDFLILVDGKQLWESRKFIVGERSDDLTWTAE